MANRRNQKRKAKTAGSQGAANSRPAPNKAKASAKLPSGTVQKPMSFADLDPKDLGKLDPANVDLLLKGLRDLQSRNHELEQKQQALVESSNDYNQVDIRKVVTLTMSKGMQEKVGKAVISILFRNVKFVTDQSKSKELAMYLVDYVHQEAELKNMTQAYKDSFAISYMDLVELIISNRRNYVQQQMRIIITTLMTTGGDEPDYDLAPCPDLMLKCALRDIDVTKPDELQSFMWYWEQILAKAGGESMWFRDEFKYKVLPSQCTYKFEDFDQEFKLFPAATEAFQVLVYENCIAKWKEQAKWKHEHPGENLPVKNKINKAEALHKTKYTITDIGQQKYGGWSDAGLARFNALKKAIKASRNIDIEVDIVDPETGDSTPTMVKKHLYVEQKALESFQELHKKDEPTESKKRKRDLATTVVVDLDLDD